VLGVLPGVKYPKGNNTWARVGLTREYRGPRVGRQGNEQYTGVSTSAEQETKKVGAGGNIPNMAGTERRAEAEPCQRVAFRPTTLPFSLAWTSTRRGRDDLDPGLEQKHKTDGLSFLWDRDNRRMTR